MCNNLLYTYVITDGIVVTSISLTTRAALENSRECAWGPTVSKEMFCYYKRTSYVSQCEVRRGRRHVQYSIILHHTIPILMDHTCALSVKGFDHTYSVSE